MGGHNVLDDAMIQQDSRSVEEVILHGFKDVDAGALTLFSGCDDGAAPSLAQGVLHLLAMRLVAVVDALGDVRGDGHGDRLFCAVYVPTVVVSSHSTVRGS